MEGRGGASGIVRMKGRKLQDGTGAQVAPEALKHQIHLDPSSWGSIAAMPHGDHCLDELESALANGQCASAAERACVLLLVADESELRRMVLMLAGTVRKMGDKKAAHRPRKDGAGGSPLDVKDTLRAWQPRMARAAWKDAVTAHDLIVGKTVEPSRLAHFAVFACGLSLEGSRATTRQERFEAVSAAFEVEPKEAITTVLPHARAMLANLGLLNVTRAFSSHAMDVISARYNVSIDRIKKAK